MSTPNDDLAERLEAVEHRTASLLERCRQTEAANRALVFQLERVTGRVEVLEAAARFRTDIDAAVAVREQRARADA